MILETLKKCGGLITGIFLLVVLILSMINALQPEQHVVRLTLTNYDATIYTGRKVERQISWCMKNQDCATLAEAAYYEARNQDDVGVVAVMRVILNRVEHKRWPSTIKEVVYNNCQFSYVCDGSLKRASYEGDQWNRMYSVAYKVLIGGKGRQKFSGITHYHTTAVNPHWAKHYETVALLGDHIFYKCQKMC